MIFHYSFTIFRAINFNYHFDSLEMQLIASMRAKENTHYEESPLQNEHVYWLVTVVCEMCTRAPFAQLRNQCRPTVIMLLNRKVMKLTWNERSKEVEVRMGSNGGWERMMHNEININKSFWKYVSIYSNQSHRLFSPENNFRTWILFWRQPLMPKTNYCRQPKTVSENFFLWFFFFSFAVAASLASFPVYLFEW